MYGSHTNVVCVISISAKGQKFIQYYTTRSIEIRDCISQPISTLCVRIEAAMFQCVCAGLQSIIFILC